MDVREGVGGKVKPVGTIAENIVKRDGLEVALRFLVKLYLSGVIAFLLFGGLSGLPIWLFEGRSLQYALFVSSTLMIGSTLLWTFLTALMLSVLFVKIYFEGKAVGKFLGEHPQSISGSLVRSVDGKHQFRAEMDTYHLEIIEPEKSLVLQNYVLGLGGSVFTETKFAKFAGASIESSQYLAMVDKPKPKNLQVTHWDGLPPKLIRVPYDREELPWPQFLILVPRREGYFLIRFTADGRYAGDTWHQTIEEAKRQAEFEYGITEDAWEAVAEIEPLQSREFIPEYLLPEIKFYFIKHTILIVVGILLSIAIFVPFTWLVSGSLHFARPIVFVLVGIVAPFWFLYIAGKLFRALIKGYFEGEAVDKFIGENPQKVAEVPTFVRRSVDGKHQLRYESGYSVHYHLEVIEPEKLLVLRNYVVLLSSTEINEIEFVGSGGWYGKSNQYFARVDEPKPKDLQVVHWHGVPPKLIRWPFRRKRLPWPQVLILEAGDEGYFLTRFAKPWPLTRTARYAGDTWHRTIEEAKRQAEFEYGIAEDAWRPVPEGVEDVVRFALNQRDVHEASRRDT